MAINREFDQNANTVQLTYKGWPITPKMRLDDPKQLLDGMSQALELAYQKIRDARIEV
jgi:hypothetical protein